MKSNGTKVKLLLTEDLSPHKISLLFLINLYCLNKIPEIRFRSTLTTLVHFLENDTIYDENDELVVIPSLKDLCFSLNRSIVSEQYGEDSAHTDSINLQRLLLESLWNINSVENLDYNISKFYNLLSNPSTVLSKENAEVKHISSRSLIGSFIHKIITAFRLLKFDEVFLLFESFVDYREPSRELYLSLGGIIRSNVEEVQEYKVKFSSIIVMDRDQFRKENPHENNGNDDILFDKLNSQLSETVGTTIPTSSQSILSQSTKLLPVPKHDLQVLLDKQIHLLETHGTETPHMLKEIMYLMTSPISNTCSIQNINFNNLPSYYYIKYLENLHDSNYNGAFEALHQYFDYMVSNNSKYFYHFALISRASLHQFFGEDEKAIDAIEEAISVARENKDNSTLTYILSWLFNFMKNKPELWKKQTFCNNNDESQLLDFLIKKSQSVSLSLYSMSYNFETLQIMNNGGSMNKYLESLLKATYISINDQIASFIKSTEISATVWSRIGISCLSDAYNEISIDSTNKKNDKISIQIRSNFLQFLKGETELAYQNLEQLKEQIKNDHSLYSSIQIRGLIMLIKLNLFKGRFRISKEIIEILLNNEIKEIELKNELILLKIETEIVLENYSKALSIISQRLNDSNNSNTYLTIKLNLLKCKVFNLSGCYSRGVTLVIQQIQQGKKIGFLTIVVEGLLLFISILNNMGYYNDCYRILHQIMPTVLSIDNKECISHGYYEFAKTSFNLYKRSQNNNYLFNKVLKYLNLSIIGFKSSINLIMLTKCFKLKEEMADVKGEANLINHSKTSIEKLDIRAKEESDYGFVFKR